MSRPRAAGVLAAVAGCCFAAPSLAAEAATSVSMRPSFLPDRLGASTAFTLALRFTGGEEGVPAPLRALTVRLPAGLSIDLRGVSTCRPSRLGRAGARGCPSRALIGRGQASLIVHAGSQTIAEQSALWVFRGPSRAASPTLEIFGQGETPLYQSATSTALVQPDSAPFGTKLAVSVPPIPTITYEPDASFSSLSLTLGGAGRSPRAHAAGAIVVPRRCPPGGFPFAASFAFADQTSASASAKVPCP